MDKAEWYAECKKLAGDRWDWMAAWFSFEAAYKAGQTPEQAVADCLDREEDT